MADYQYVCDLSGERMPCVRRVIDGALIPSDAVTADGDAFRAWLAAGNVPDDAVLPPVSLVPQEVPMWAAQAALKDPRVGKYDAINRFIAGDATASPPVPSLENTNPPVFFAWTMGNFASRQSTLMAALASQFDMADADIDAVFQAANEIAQAAA